MRRLFIAAGAALLATACTMASDRTDPVVLGSMATPTTAMPYLQMAASSDLFEIESSRLALQMSRNPAVQSFAQMLIGDHTRLSNNMMATARRDGLVPPPPQLLPHHADMLNRLLGESATDFDMMYRQEQVNAHQEALNLHRTYAADGDRDALRTVAMAAVPVIQGHLTHAQTLPSTPAAQPVTQQPTYTPTPVTRAGERG